MNPFLKKIVLFSVLFIGFSSCREEEKTVKISDASYYHACINKLTDVIVYDIFSPPVASRIYSYATLAAYEALSPENPSQMPSMSGKAKSLKESPKPDKKALYCYPLASMKAFMTVARTLTFSVEKYDELEKDIIEKFKKQGISTSVIERSMAYGESVGKHIVEYSKSDNYGKTRGLRYSLQNKSGTWEPTPPAYAESIEPYWGTIRPMTLDTASQFMPPRPPAFDLKANSAFMKELQEVKKIGETLTEDQKNIAWFWDDNAFVMNVQGHVMFADKKMTPGGHWLAITQTVCKAQKADIQKAVQAYMLVSFALRDAFISCWDEKYRSHKIRPETAINKHLDTDWKPFLQTPPFPEYTSGHSTISGASAEVLSQLFGEKVSFTDSTEHKYGHGVRTFQSFREAASEASISRVYGGIHYRSGCVEGLKIGEKVGKWVMEKTK